VGYGEQLKKVSAEVNQGLLEIFNQSLCTFVDSSKGVGVALNSLHPPILNKCCGKATCFTLSPTFP
jgi:hypothetical protein